MEENGIAALVILGFCVVGVVAKPGVALVICGLLVAFGGVLATGAGALGVPFAVGGVVSGVALVGFGRAVMMLEALLTETRLARAGRSEAQGEAGGARKRKRAAAQEGDWPE